MGLFSDSRWRAFLSQKTSSPSHIKSSRMAPLVALQNVGQPVWTPRQYDKLAYEGYQKNVVVYRSVNLIARSLASIPLTLFLEDRRLKEHPILSLLKCPSHCEAGSAFMESLVSYLLLSGNSYIETVNDENDIPQELYTLRPDRMRIVPARDGSVDRYEYQLKGQTRAISVDSITGKSNVLHIKLFHPLNDWYGMSPLEAAASAIDQHNMMSSHNLALLQNGGRPSGALVINGDNQAPFLNDEQRTRLREDVKAVYAGAQNAGKIVVLEGDFEWKEMGLSPKDLDFVEGRSFSAREIAQAFGVPPMLVGVPGDATFANYREARFHLWEDTILPLVNFILAELNLWLVPRFGESLRLDYDLDDIPALSMRREALWSRLEACSFLTQDEKRDMLGFPPLKVEPSTNYEGER
jgi:HK97 family phage portal protein